MSNPHDESDVADEKCNWRFVVSKIVRTTDCGFLKLGLPIDGICPFCGRKVEAEH